MSSERLMVPRPNGTPASKTNRIIMTYWIILRKYKKRTLALLCVLVICGLVFPSIETVQCAKLVDRIIAVVNDDIITLVELNERYQPYAEKIKSMGYPFEKEKQMLFSVRENIINELIDRQLTVQEIKRVKINVDEKEIDAAIERLKEMNFLTDEKLRKALASQGLSMEQYRENIKDQILRTKLVTREVKSKIVVTDDDIKSYYEKHPEVYGGKKKYHLRNIIMRVTSFSSQSEKQKTAQRMEEIYKKLQNGESFEALARTYSEAPSAAEGGNLGQFSIEDLSPQLQQAVKELMTGEYTPVLETDQGFQIFYIQDIFTTPGKPLEEVASEIQQILYKESVDMKFRSWIEELRGKSHIKIIK